MKRTYLQINAEDNVAVALTDLPAGHWIELADHGFPLAEAIPAKHKFTLSALQTGEAVYMYGILVGTMTQPVARGGLLTVFNLVHAASGYSGKTGSYTWQPPDVTRWQDRRFDGFHRPDGQVGTHNFWLVIPLVFCENRNIGVLKEAFLQELGYAQPSSYRQQVKVLADFYRSGAGRQTIGNLTVENTKPATQANPLFPNVSGIKFLTHDAGCGGTREDALNLCRLLAGYCVHPNVGGITVLSLGCQHAQATLLQQAIAEKSPEFSKTLHIFEQQKWPSEAEMLGAAIKATFLGLMELNEQQRQPAPLSKLTIGVECGGSDGFSGISANPAIGHAADIVTALGGKVILSEFPELCGVEQELLNRCVNGETAGRFTYLMQEYQRKAEAVGSGFDMNPSPGNIKDGLITDAIKSAGAAKKGGTSPVTDVLGYGDYATRPGLTLLCTPGNDVESTTGMAGAGAHIQLFSTGLGTPTGNPVSPVVKVSSNTILSRKMKDIIDVDAGTIITGDETVEEVGEEIMEYIIGLASGQYLTKAMQLGQDDFIFWKTGVSL